jgi:D-alanyl-D-alanine carboxypeptidase
MRNLLAENLEKAATKRTVAAITERNPADGSTDVAQDEVESRPTPPLPAPSAAQFTSASAQPTAAPAARSNKLATPSILAAAAASAPTGSSPQAKPEPAPLTNGVIQGEALAAIPGSSEPMKPVRVKTVQVKAGTLKLASAGPQQTTSTTSAISPTRPAAAETSSSLVAKAEITKPEIVRADVPKNDMPPQPANHGTGNGLLGVLPASSVPSASAVHAMAYADQGARSQPQPSPQKVMHSGWIVQVGALESESEALKRIDAARNQARGLLAKADPFTEAVAKGDQKLYRARFAGLDREQAEAVCRTLKRSEISCITVRN